MKLPDALIALLREPSICCIATSMADGSPQLTQTWVDTDGEHVLINTVQGYLKLKNVARDPRVAVAISEDMLSRGQTTPKVYGLENRALALRGLTEAP